MVEFFVFMSEQWVLVSVFVVLVFLFAVNERIKSGTPISSHVVTRMMNTDEGVLLDIRDTKEFGAGHVAGAINIPQAKLMDRIAELEHHREKVIIVADKNGQQSGPIGRKLKQKQFNVLRLAGGMMEWQNAKLPVIKG